MENQLDPQVVNLAKAIRQTESGGNYTVQGKSGERGGYQFTEPTWNATAPKYGIKTSLKDATPEQQNAVAYNRIKEWKDRGHDVTQIASMWNAGEGEPDAYTGKFSSNTATHKAGDPSVGINKFGAKYDVPTYAKSVASAYLKLKNGQQVEADPNNPSSVANAQNQPLSPPQQKDKQSSEQYGALFPSQTGEGVAQELPKAIGNLPSSAINMAKNLGNIALHPVKTIEDMASLLFGVGEKIGAGIKGDKNYKSAGTEKVDALVQHLKDRYGSLENFQRTATNDPFGVGTDVFTVLEGGAALADKALGTTGMDIAKNTAEVADTAGQAEMLKGGVRTMPQVEVGEGAVGGMLNKGLQGAADAATYIPRKIGGYIKGAGEEAAGLATGTGAGVIKQGLKAAQEGGDSYDAFVKGLKGGASPEELVGEAKDALGQVIQNRRTAYQDQLAEMAGDTKSYDTSPIFDEVNKQLEKFNVTKSSDGSLDFSRSALRFNKPAQADIQQIVDTMSDYGLREGDRTAVGIDNLKKAFGDLYTPSGQARAFVEAMRAKTREILSQVPGYNKLTSEYEATTGQIEDIQKGLSLGDKAMVETSFKKIISALRQNNEFRAKFIRELDDVTGGKLLSKIAGQQLSPLLPRGLSGKVEQLGALHTALTGTGLLPLMGSFLVSSPKLIGQLLRAAGLSTRAAESVMSVFTPTVQNVGLLGGNAVSQLAPQGGMQQQSGLLQQQTQEK